MLTGDWDPDTQHQPRKEPHCSLRREEPSPGPAWPWECPVPPLVSCVTTVPCFRGRREGSDHNLTERLSGTRPALGTEQGSRISARASQPRMRVLHRPCLSRQLSRETAVAGKPASLATGAARPGVPSSPGQFPGGATVPSVHPGPPLTRTHRLSRLAQPWPAARGDGQALAGAGATVPAPGAALLGRAAHRLGDEGQRRLPPPLGDHCKPNSPGSQTQPLANQMLPLNQPPPLQPVGLGQELAPPLPLQGPAQDTDPSSPTTSSLSRQQRLTHNQRQRSRLGPRHGAPHLTPRPGKPCPPPARPPW